MKRAVLHLVIVVLAFAASACATARPPIAREEFFPQRNADASLGLLKNRGTTNLNVWIYDQVERLLKEIYFPPAQDALSYLAVDQRRRPVIVVEALPPGNYRVVYVPFYYETRWFSPNYRVDLQRGSSSIYVGRDPYTVYDSDTRRHWGWVLELNGGDMPRGPGLRNIQITIGD